MLEIRTEIRQLSRGNQKVRPQLQLKKLWIIGTKTSEEKANNMITLSGVAVLLFLHHGSEEKVILQKPSAKVLSANRTGYRCAPGDFYTFQLRVSQRLITSFWYEMKGN